MGPVSHPAQLSIVDQQAGWTRFHFRDRYRPGTRSRSVAGSGEWPGRPGSKRGHVRRWDMASESSVSPRALRPAAGTRRVLRRAGLRSALQDEPGQLHPGMEAELAEDL